MKDTDSLSLNEFANQMQKYGLEKLDWDKLVIIRGSECEYGVKAVRVQDGRMVIDLGVIL